MSLAMAVNAKISLPSVISDGMVLQQQADVCLWGWADAGETVNITTSWGEKATTKAGKDGTWKMSVKTGKASFNEEHVYINNGAYSFSVLIGEVWLASGQSNMEMPLKGFAGACVKDGYRDAMQAMRESPYVRMFNVELKQTFTRQDNCRGAWLKPTFENALEYSATAYYFASALSNALDVPVGIVNCSYGGSRVESWSSPETCRDYADVPKDSVGVFSGEKTWERPLVTYNAMFWPIHLYTCKGIIWYQGCSNVGYDNYAVRLQHMVSQWRSEMGQGNLPFYQVQIAPYAYSSDDSDAAARLREQQQKSCELIPNSDIICTIDLVEPFEKHNIHPCEKRTVGTRLSLMALNKTYGKTNLPYSGPRYDPSKFSIDGNTATVGFTTDRYGICRNHDLEGFEIAGEDKVFHPAKADFQWRTNTVKLTSPAVPHPVAVRYCFKDFQIGNVIGGAELPLFPFRTDNW